MWDLVTAQQDSKFFTDNLCSSFVCLLYISKTFHRCVPYAEIILGSWDVSLHKLIYYSKHLNLFLWNLHKCVSIMLATELYSYEFMMKWATEWLLTNHHTIVAKGDYSYKRLFSNRLFYIHMQMNISSI